MKKTILILILITIFSCNEKQKKDWKTETPTFELLESKGDCNMNVITGKLNLLETDLSIHEKRKIREQFKGKANWFNCEYEIFAIEQSDQSSKMFIFSLRSGDFITSFTANNGILFRKESSLIIIDPIDNTGTPDKSTEYWNMENGKFFKIK